MKRVLLAMAAIAFAGMATGAAASGPAFYAPDNAPVTLKTIFSNLGKKYPKGVYECCSGGGVAGPDNLYGDAMRWSAMAFTPTSGGTVKRVEVGAGWTNSGTNKLAISLYSDAGGVPGSEIKRWHATSLPIYTFCCNTVSVHSAVGTPVSAGVQYWIVLRTDNTDPDTSVIWNYTTTNQVDAMLVAEYCSEDHGGAGHCGAYNNAWRPSNTVPGFALAVYGE